MAAEMMPPPPVPETRRRLSSGSVVIVWKKKEDPEQDPEQLVAVRRKRPASERDGGSDGPDSDGLESLSLMQLVELARKRVQVLPIPHERTQLSKRQRMHGWRTFDFE